MAIDIEIAPKIAAFRAGMAQIPGITAEAADEAAEAMRVKLWRKAAADAAGLTNKIEREAAKQQAAIERAAKEEARAVEKSLKEQERARKAAHAEAERSLRRQTQVLAQQLKEQERAEREAAKASAAAVAQQQAGWVGLGKQVSALAGGPFSQLGQVVFELTPKAGAATAALGSVAVAGGLVGAGVLAIGIAGIAAARGVDTIVDSAEAAVKRLKEIEGAPPLPAETIASIDAYQHAALGAEVQWNILTAKVGAGIASAFEPGVHVLSGFVEQLNEVAGSGTAAGKALDVVEGASRKALMAVTLGASEAVVYALELDRLEEAGRGAAEGLEEVEKTTKALTEHMTAAEKFADMQADALIAMTGASDAQQRAAKEMEKVDDVTKDYVDTLDRAIPEQLALINAAIETAEVRKRQIVAETEAAEAAKRLTAETQAQTKAQTEADRATREAAAQREKLLKINEKEIADAQAYQDKLAKQLILQREIADMNREDALTMEEFARKCDEATAAMQGFDESVANSAQNLELIRDASMDAFGSIGEVIQTVAAQNMQYLDQQLAGEEAHLAVLEERRQKLLDINKDVENQSATAREAAREGIKGINGQIDAEKKRILAIEERKRKTEQAAVAGFYLEQAAALGGVVVHGAEAFAALTAAMAYLGPGAPLAAGAIVAPMVAAQTAAIVTADPPTSHHDGGVIAPDEIDAGGMRLRRSERLVVFNERAVQNGAPERAERMNRDLDSAAGGRPVVLQDAGRTIAELWIEEAERPNSRVSRYLAAMGR